MARFSGVILLTWALAATRVKRSKRKVRVTKLRGLRVSYT